jgi:hypothetical protein
LFSDYTISLKILYIYFYLTENNPKILITQILKCNIKREKDVIDKTAKKFEVLKNNGQLNKVDVRKAYSAPYYFDSKEAQQ